ncbi:hypothetical protein [Legionella micdadei]|uniref:HEPN AbiU2-like domain-containing protein n=1 Tax=Legionella micdadei TaxID=451 RepID=A0A098GI79_LEGMI|nr:hypothetical protein [Legionella micdadei]KTD28818.1 hypothetical protein Lmic_0738 [Legionella micdadei]CEG62194.1 protein of unknown function [Legionella micdadei]SCY07777.1 hypothetical protein SAMN02982997_00800 [Legionella micdadei]
MSPELQRIFDVILHHVAKSFIHFNYSVTFFEMLQKNQHFSIPKTHFIMDMHESNFNYSVQCLIKLYDQQRDALGLFGFLRRIKEEISLSMETYLDCIDADFKALEYIDLQRLIKKLKTIRDKKQFHIDRRNVLGPILIDPETNTPITMSLEEIKILLDRALSIVSNYERLFEKSIKACIDMPSGIEEVMSLLETVCFSSERESTAFY